MAVREAALLAFSCLWPKTLIESDKLSIIEGLRSQRKEWTIDYFIEDIQKIYSYLPCNVSNAF
ncbi:hypothetical protein SESBI_01745 [Sesbania bispinosa]|nr:hypothetical protein SESBI_01745 [Sesbania bispinosa]